MSSTDAVNELVNKVLMSCVLEEGQLRMPEHAFLALGKTVHEANDKKRWATALIALATRLKDVAGADDAAERSATLAAIALGDVELNGMLCRQLYGAR
jgi:hypothetical protein